MNNQRPVFSWLSLLLLLGLLLPILSASFGDRELWKESSSAKEESREGFDEEVGEFELDEVQAFLGPISRARGEFVIFSSCWSQRQQLLAEFPCLRPCGLGWKMPLRI